ncbi:MAG TPA: YqgE/AlgH family protein [Burkholderiales bacterium]|nr:YqgE/AlgH family protein [Burkholderiales bacterium]
MRWIVLAAALAAAAAHAQQHEPPNAILLVAKPALTDPNFRETVVLVTQAGDSSTVGVILNRPTRLRLAELVPGMPGAERHAEPVFFGGPVMPGAIVALFHSEKPPEAPAFHVLQEVYLTMHPANVEALLAAPGRRYRLYAGFSGWAPRQLEGEMARDGWFVLAPEEAILFRGDVSGMWSELLARVRGKRTAARQ